VHFTTVGEGVIVNNEHMAHGRTDFLNGDQTQRVLARKWFTRSQVDATYKHVPGMNVASPYAEIFPNQFNAEAQRGEWRYDARTGENVKLD
jgi:hypothetical protein